MGMGQPSGEVGGLRSRSLGLGAVSSQTLALGPIFSAGFLSGTVAVFAGFNTPLSVLLAAVGVLALAYVVALYARRFAGPGAVYEYLLRGTHPGVGIVAAGTYVIGLLFLGAGGGFAGEGYFVDNLLTGQLHVHVGWGFWALATLGTVLAVNYVGVRIGLRAIVLTAGLSLVPFLVIAVAIVVRGGVDGNSLAVFDPAQTSSNAVFHGILFAVSLFIGFETVAALGDEARAPRRSIPVALVTSILLASGFYLLMTYVGAIGFGRAALERNEWFASGNPFGVLGERYVGHSLGWIIQLTIVLDLFSVCVAFVLAASRVLMTLARDGLLPRALSRTSRRFHTPVGGLAVISAWGLLVILWTALSRYGGVRISNVLQALLILSATGSYLITLVYLMLAAGGFWLLVSDRSEGKRWLGLPVVITAAAVPILSFDGSLNPFPSYPNDIAVYIAGASVVIAIAWFIALKLRRPATVSLAGRREQPDADARARSGAPALS